MGILETQQQELLQVKQEVQELKKQLSILQRCLSSNVSMQEAIQITGLSRSTLIKLRDSGKLIDVGEGRRVLFERAAIVALSDEKKPRKRFEPIKIAA